MATSETNRLHEDVESILKEDTALEIEKGFVDCGIPGGNTATGAGLVGGDAWAPLCGGGDPPIRSAGRSLQEASLVRKRLNVTESTALILTNCPSPVGLLHTFDVATGEYMGSIPKACERWDCPVCGQRKKNMLIDGIRDGALRIVQDTNLPDTERVLRHVVLTFATSDDTPPGLAFSRFRAGIAKAGIKNLRYLWVKEFTRKGKRHFHLLINRHIEHSLLKHLWSNATDRKSFYVYITRADHNIRNAGAYLGKYVAKGLHSRKFRRRERRYSSDRKTDWTPALTSVFTKPLNIRFEFEFSPSPMKALSQECLRALEKKKRPPPADDYGTAIKAT